MNGVGWFFFSNKVVGFDQLFADFTKKTPKIEEN